MAGISTRLYGPLAAVAAALATAVSSADISSPSCEKMQLGPAPYLLYAAHPSMPVPPLESMANPKSSSSNSSPSGSSQKQVIWALNSFLSESLKSHIPRPDHLLYAPTFSDGGPNLSESLFLRVYNPKFGLLPVPSRCQSIFSPPFAASEYVSSWHSRRSVPSTEKPPENNREVTVVLLGWLGAKQNHLKKYADWYTERGINAVTFVIPMSDVISFNAGEKAEQQIDQLASHLLAWMNDQEDGKEKHLFFHTFSNTGWLTYGVLLERLHHKDNKLLDKVKGCVVDSAPVAEPDPQVWASGFSAAFLKKKSVATRKVEMSDIVKDSNADELIETQLQADVTEQALLTMLEKFFSVFLRLPYVKKRLSDIVSILSSEQPKCPQLYIYSSADKVIPAKSVESFIEEQRKLGRTVKSVNLLWSPHVDHFRSFPDVYGSQVNNFIHECLTQLSPRKCA